jgi:hypothetical protein
MKQSLLILITFLSVSLGYAQDSTKKWGVLFDFDYGGIEVIDDTGITLGMSFGIHYKGKIGLGVALSTVSNYRSATGIGADIQLRPIKWLLLKAQLGTLIAGGGSFDPDANDANARESYIPDATKKFYWRGTVAFVISRYFYIGFSKMQAEPVFLFESPKSGKNFMFNKRFDTLTVQIGINIPISFKKKVKKIN